MKNKQHLGYLEGWLSIVINTVLFAVKFWVGALSRSIAMKADAWHTLSDTLTSVVVIMGFWISSRPADRKHPFGHGRAESIASIIIGTLLAVVGVDFLQQSIHRLVHPGDHPPAVFGLTAIFVFLVSVIVKEGLAQFSFWAGKKIHSGSLIADGWHHRSDAIASGLIVLGGLLSRYAWWMDGVLGVGVSLLILYAAYDVLRSATSISLGEVHSDALEDSIRDIIRSTAPSTGDIHHLHVHRYGDHLELTIHLCFPPETKVIEAHEVAARVKYALREKLGVETTVHIEPLKSE